jgi:beta-mannosidase
MITIDLNGAWQLQPDWESPRISQLPAMLFKKGEWLSANVPGTVHTDLLAGGKIPDPFQRDNECSVQWVSEIGWRYRRLFHVSAEFLAYDSIHLVAEGLDTFAAIFVNCQSVAETGNMFITHTFEIKSLLRAGDNEIEIEFDSPIQRAQDLEACHGRLPVPLESYRVFARKAQYSFGWDWGPKLATSGIWRPIRLEGYRPLRLDSVFADVHLDDDLRCAHLSVKIEVQKFSNSAAEFIVEISGPDLRAREHVRSSERNLAVEFVIEHPQLWWPNGFGDQSLYAANVIARVDGEVVDELGTRFGIRKIELRREKDAEGESFLFCVNNVRIFCKGANWIPADSFVPRISNEKYQSLLTKGREAHFNMLRVWGGGIYEQKIFYDLCDELGIMVWQDFMFACGAYPEYPEFVGNVRHEVAIIVKQLRNHPSIVLWCGNNENEWWWNMKTRRPHHEMTGALLFEKIIPDICSAHDPGRSYWQSSPFGGEDPNDERQGDHHQWNIWGNWADASSVAKNRGRFLSEFGFQAPAVLATWKKFLDEEEQLPQSPMFEQHNKQMEGTERLYRFLAGHVKMPDSFEDFIYKAQIVQAESLKTMVEHWRREKFHTAGTLFWQFNDCWPVSSWAVIDSELQPKAAFWYARRFYAPVLLSFRHFNKFIEIWVVNDTLSAFEAELELDALSFSGDVSSEYRKRMSIPANISLQVAAIPLEELPSINPRQQYLRARLKENGQVVTENRHFFIRYKHLELGKPELTCQMAKVNACDWRVKINTDRFVKSLALPAPPSGAALTENYFDLDAGSDAVIEIKNVPENQTLKLEDLRWNWLL